MIRGDAAFFAAKSAYNRAKRAKDSLQKKYREALIDALASHEEFPVLKPEEVNQHEGKLFGISFGNRLSAGAFRAEDGNIVLFEKHSRSNDTLPLRLKPIKELKEALNLPMKATIEEVARHLNRMTVHNKLVITTGERTPVIQRGIDPMDAIRNMGTRNSDGFWETLMIRITRELEEAEERGDIRELEKLRNQAEMISQKLEKIIGEEQGGYVAFRPGRKRFTAESQQKFLEELEETDVDLANQITKEGTGETGVKIVGVFPQEEIVSLGEEIISFLNRKYSQKMAHRAQQESILRPAPKP